MNDKSVPSQDVSSRDEEPICAIENENTLLFPINSYSHALRYEV
jgi:hypothetical protein